MYFSDKILNLCLFYWFLISINCELNSNQNHYTSDDIEKRRSVREFFDSLVAGSNQNTKTSTHSQSTGSISTPRPEGPIYMPFAVPVHSPQQHTPHLHHSHPHPSHSHSHSHTYGYPYRPPPPPPTHPRPHMSYAPMGPSFSQPHHSHNHNYVPISPSNQNFAPQSHHYPVPHSHNHYEYGQHSHTRPIAIAIPLPLHAIPLHLISNSGENKQNNYLSNNDFPDGISSPTSKYTMFADPYEDMAEEDLFDNIGTRFKFIPIHKNEQVNL